MTLHEGKYLGPQAEPIVELHNALGLFWMLITGTSMELQRLLPQSHAQEPKKEDWPAGRIFVWLVNPELGWQRIRKRLPRARRTLKRQQQSKRPQPW
ncbi:MAG: hypothetical protein AB8A40_05795 [Prochlorococcus sp.]